MRAKLAFRTRFRLTRRYRGWLPLRRALFHRRLRSVRVLRGGLLEQLAED